MNAAQKSALEVQCSAGTSVPQNPQPTEPGSCSFLQYSGVCRDVLGHINAVHLGRVSYPPTAPFLKDKHPLQVNQITSQQSSL